MLLLLMVPVLVLVTSGHRCMQLHAPSNAVVARARFAPPQWRSGLLLAILASTTLMAMHLLATWLAAGGPGWLNLVVVILAWDTMKFGLAAAGIVLRCSAGVWRHRRTSGVRKLIA